MAASLLAAPSLARSDNENERVSLGLIGTGGMGMNHLRALCERSDVEVAWLSDVDEVRLGKAVEYAALMKP